MTAMKTVMLIFLLIFAVISDARTCKIKNIIVFPFLFAGLMINMLCEGIHGLQNALGGIFMPFVLLFLLYALKMLGAGDIKLFAAIGALMGSSFILSAMAYSFLAGGAMAITVMLVNKNGFLRIQHLWRYLKGCFLNLSLMPYTDFANRKDGAKFPFAYAIAGGTGASLIQFCSRYFKEQWI